MTKLLTLFTAIALAATAAPAFAADDTATTKSETKVESDSDGNYSRDTTVENEDEAGTTTKGHTKVKVKHDRHGNVKKTVQNKSSTDPEGLMNKTTAKDDTTVEENTDGSTSYKHKRKVNGKAVEDEQTESK